MGLGTCMLSLMVVILITGVQSTDKGLDEECTASDVCVDTGTTCSNGRCLLKVDQVCTMGGKLGLCVVGASCNAGGQCACGTGYTPAITATGLCTESENKYGGPCKSDNTCDATGLMCDTATGKCKCQADMKPRLSDGTCEAISNGELGKVCTGPSDTTACTTADNLICSAASSTCVCKPGYSGILGGPCGPLGNGEIGKDCTAVNKDTNCGQTCVTNLDCVDDVCTCVSGYTGVKGGTCSRSVNLIGGICSDSAACGGGPHVTCVTSLPKLCKSVLGGICTMDSDCSDSANMLCDGQVHRCLLKPTKSCTMNTGKCSSGATCTNNVCTCDTAITTAAADKCMPKANKVGGSCNTTCDDPNAECTNLNVKVCTCMPNFTFNKQSLTCSKAEAVVASMTLMLVATLAGLFTRL